MSDSDTAGRVQAPATTGSATTVPAAPHPDPTALLVLDRTTGRVAASNPAGRRRLAGLTGARLGHWLADLATAAGHRDAAVVRTWADPLTPGGRRVRALSLPIDFRTRECLLVVLRDDAAAPMPLPPGAADGVPAADHSCAAFTLDTVGRVDSWGATPQRLVGYRAEQVIGADTTLLHPAPARLAGDHHRALTQAYRAGEHCIEGWRLCSDGRMIWAEIITAPLYDPAETLLGFAQLIQDLSPVRRLQPQREEPLAVRRPLPEPHHVVDLRAVPVPRLPAAPPTAPAPPAGGPTRGPRRPAGRVPVQRRP